MKRGREDGASSLAAGKRSSGARPVSAPNAANKLTTNDALSYLREVKNRFSDNKAVYDTFLEIMKEFKAQRIDTSGVIQRVKSLFKGHRGLVLGFNTFLPKGYEIELARVSDDEEEEVAEQPVEFDQAITYVNKIKIRFASDERIYKAFLEILNKYRKGQKTISNVYQEVAVLFSHHQDLLDEFTYFLPDNSQPQPPVRGRQPRPVPTVNRGTVIRGRTGPTAPSPADPRSVHKRKAAKRADEGFKAGYGTPAYEREEEPAIRPALNKELQFFDRIKQRLRNRDAYTDLLKCLNLYSQEIVSRHELMFLVSDIIGKFPDLMNGFLEFVGKVEVMEIDLMGGAKPNDQLVMQREMIRQKELQMDKYMTKPLSEIVANKQELDKYMTKPLSEIVANEQERVTPSYVLIPEGFPKLATSGRTDLGHSVLNESFVNVITGSEDYSFKLMRKNQYEEALFRCEDDRYEFEMCIETNYAALKLLRPLVDETQKMNAEDRNSYQLESSHPLNGPVPANAIDRLYAESGAHVVEHLRRHPGVVGPIVLARMEAKDAEWRKIREEMTKNCYNPNPPMSPAEKKSLIAKAMVSEIRDIAETRKAEQPHASMEATYRSMLCQARRFEPPSSDTPDLSYDYSERIVFDDCWSVIRAAILESTGSGSKMQVVELYLRAMEPYFGLPVREEEVKSVKDEMREKRAARLRAVAGEDSERDSSGHDEDGKRAPESTPEPGADTDLDVDDGIGKKRSQKAKGKDSGTTSDGEGGSDDEEKTEGLGCCMPVTPYFVPPSSRANADGSGAGKPSHASKPSRLLLANESIFILFRFHRHLYERMRTARRCSMQQAQQQCAAEGGDLTPAEVEAKAQLKEHADRVHTSFMGMTQQVLAGELETVLYEDQVRALLGTNSYELFTIDKLLHKLIGFGRGLLKASHWQLPAYLTLTLTRSHDTVFRIEYHDTSTNLTIQLLEGERPDGSTRQSQRKHDRSLC
eukprot:gene7940-1154_t